jgi:HSP20 family protein
MALVPYKSKNLVEYDPFRYLENVQRQINRLFNNFSLTPFSGELISEEGWAPTVDVCDTKDKVIICAELPGLKKEDIEVNVYDNSLTIKGN